MPYIVSSDREKFDYLLGLLSRQIGDSAQVFYDVVWRLGECLVEAYSPKYFRMNKDGFCNVHKLALELGNVAGNYNYALTVLSHNFIKNTGLKYANLNSLMGLLEEAKDKVLNRCAQFGGSFEGRIQFKGMYRCMTVELYFALIFPYEQKKRKTNGPVSDFDVRYYAFESCLEDHFPGFSSNDYF